MRIGNISSMATLHPIITRDVNLQDSRKRSADVFTWQGLEINPANGQVVGPGGQVRVEPRVMALLQVLASRPGELVTREEVLREIWPGNGVYDEALTQCIYQLRLQLCEAGGSEAFRKLLKTVPKRGYILLGEVSVPETAQPTAPNQAEVLEDTPTNATPRRNLTRAGWAVLLLVITFSGWYLFRAEQNVEAGVPQALNIAVLPFLPLVSEQRDAPLELGMADTLITRLSTLSQIVVRPINSVRGFSNLDRDAIELGKRLQVGAVVDGTIQRFGDELRVTARLLRVEDGTALWADSFNAEFSQVFSVQDQICEQIAASLAPQLQPSFSNSYAAGTNNTAAYELFLKGRYHLALLTRPDLQASLDYFQQAVTLDPNYAHAWLGLASVNFRMPLAAEVPPGDHYPRAREAALRALEIDDSLAEGHALLGWVSFWHEHDWAASESHFKHAISLNANEFESRLGYAHLLSNTGHDAEALVQIRRARQINPMFPMGAVLEAQFLQSAGKYAEALRMIEEASRQNPNFWLARMNLAELYFYTERYNEAIAEIEHTRKLAPDSNFVMATQVAILHTAGKTAEAEAVVDEMMEKASQVYVSPYHLAMAYAGIGDDNQALVWLDQAVIENNPMLVFLGVDRIWNGLRDRPEFAVILRQVNLEDYSN
jgi:TolB-like protein/DNA-binding winged helix-turn-helix (wHTH) protein/Tfp pilus assembly protein PilF